LRPLAIPLVSHLVPLTFVHRPILQCLLRQLLTLGAVILGCRCRILERT
jgi:hypothetical protein